MFPNEDQIKAEMLALAEKHDFDWSGDFFDELFILQEKYFILDDVWTDYCNDLFLSDAEKKNQERRKSQLVPGMYETKVTTLSWVKDVI